MTNMDNTVFEISFDESAKILHVKTVGVLTPNSLVRFTDIAMHRFHNFGQIKLLADWSEYISTAPEAQGKGIYASAQMAVVFSKIAILSGPEHYEEIKSWKKLSNLPIEVFDVAALDDAEKWLSPALEEGN